MTAAEANQKLSSDLGLVMRDAQELLKATAGAASDQVGEVRGRLTRALESARSTCGRLQAGSVRAAKTTDHVIREHPYQSLGIALGTGVLVGALIARR